MSLKILSVLIFFALFAGAQPRPLPDDRYPQDPGPGEPPPYGGEVTYTLGAGDSERFGNKRMDFYPRTDLNRVMRLRLVGQTNTVDIKEVRVIFADRREERSILSLQGELRPGSGRSTLLGGRAVYRIEVVAASTNLWKKPGGYRVDVTVLK